MSEEQEVGAEAVGWEKQLKRRDIFFGLMVVLMLIERYGWATIEIRSGDLVFGKEVML
jgi:hypothetical protein